MIKEGSLLLTSKLINTLIKLKGELSLRRERIVKANIKTNLIIRLKRLI